MPQSSQPIERSLDLSPDTNKSGVPSNSVTTDTHKALTFPLRWRFYSLVYFLVIGTSGSIFLGSAISEILFGRILGSPLSMWWEWMLFFFSPIVILVWFGTRLVQDFRARVTFTPAGIGLYTPRYKPTLPWATPQREHQTFTWAQIRHIEVLPDVIAVQFPTTAVVFHLTPQQHTQFMELTQACLPHPEVITEAQVLQDFWCRSRSFLEKSGIMATFFSPGLIVALLMAMIFFEASGLFIPVFWGYLGGYLLLGVLRLTPLSRRVVLTTNGVIDGSSSKSRMLGLFYSVHPPSREARDFPLPPKDNRVLVPWIPWPEITHYRVYSNTVLLRSAQGLLEIWGLAKKDEVKELIKQQIAIGHLKGG